jgi:hypothetical protein
MRQTGAVDGDRSVDDDILTGHGHDGLDERRKPARAEAVTEITALARQREDIARRWANEYAIVDARGAAERFDPPQPQWIARCEINSETGDERHSSEARQECERGDHDKDCW